MWIQKVIAVVFLASIINAQEDDLSKIIDSIYSTTKDFLDDFGEVVTTPRHESFGAVERCGEGADQGIHTCVPYYNCDGATKTIIPNINTDGTGIINIRLNEKACDHFLDVCCKIPSGGIPPNVTTQKPMVDDKEPIVTTIPPPTPGRGNFCGIRNPNGIGFKLEGNRDNEAEFAEFPWMVEILHRTTNGGVKAICGASLITPVVVVTGAHCVSKFRTSDIKIRAGEWDTQTTRERIPYQERDVTEIIVHEGFNSQSVINNIAVLILSEPLAKADNVGTVCMPAQDMVFNSRQCFVSGWGQEQFGNPASKSVILKKIQLPMVSKERCQAALRTTRLGKLFNLHDSFICAGGEGGKDACTGDGGGPLVCPDARNPSRYLLAGIVSWGIGCGEHGIPGVYADVSKFRTWIDNQMFRQNLDTTPYVV